MMFIRDITESGLRMVFGKIKIQNFYRGELNKIIFETDVRQNGTFEN